MSEITESGSIRSSMRVFSTVGLNSLMLAHTTALFTSNALRNVQSVVLSHVADNASLVQHAKKVASSASSTRFSYVEKVDGSVPVYKHSTGSQPAATKQCTRNQPTTVTIPRKQNATRHTNTPDGQCSSVPHTHKHHAHNNTEQHTATCSNIHTHTHTHRQRLNAPAATFSK